MLIISYLILFFLNKKYNINKKIINEYKNYEKKLKDLEVLYKIQSTRIKYVKV